MLNLMRSRYPSDDEEPVIPASIVTNGGPCVESDSKNKQTKDSFEPQHSHQRGALVAENHLDNVQGQSLGASE